MVKPEMVVVEIAHSRNLSWCNEQHPAGISVVVELTELPIFSPNSAEMMLGYHTIGL